MCGDGVVREGCPTTTTIPVTTTTVVIATTTTAVAHKCVTPDGYSYDFSGGNCGVATTTTIGVPPITTLPHTGIDGTVLGAIGMFALSVGILFTRIGKDRHGV